MEVKRTERGWPGHFICAYQCLFRRNTLLEYGPAKIVVSTVGRLAIRKDGKTDIEPVGYERYYETMAFHSDPKDSIYHNIDAAKWLDLGCGWQLNELDDIKANDMHEKAVIWVTEQLLKNNLL
jgi:hypothetical protein|uniref:Methionine biosynthesis protein MetW n=1 Tax=Podoviridae sp. ctz6O13 TaxID=2827757 RepID=A0A8S5TLA0_9CAUD|nr:MAG TPA: Methionine biosynthesis protein MetW [Podoviridae sp. ctz6O13]